MVPKVIPKSGFSRHGDFVKSMVLPTKNTHFEVLNILKGDPKSNKKPFKIDARKNDAKIVQNRAKMEPKKSTKNPSKMRAKKTMNFRREAGEIFGSPRSPKTHTIQQDKQQINSRKTKKEDNLQKITYRTSSKGNLLIDDLQS